MATKPDLKAQKERKQKIVLAACGVLLLGVLALQLPKLLSHSGGTAAAAPATTTGATTATTAAPAVPTTGGSSGAVSVSASKNSAKLAGVLLAPAAAPAAGEGQLWSFSRFKAKDPFVQQVQGAAVGSTTPGSSPSSSAAGGGSPSAAGGGVPKTATTPVALAFATLLVNGRLQQLTIRNVFPKADPIFVLAKLGDKTARIGVAGGSFTRGRTMLLKLGKPVTLMNTTTGQRYVVKLVYVGAQPETIASFKGGPTTPTAGSGSSSATVSTP
jgi:hypothetical protein